MKEHAMSDTRIIVGAIAGSFGVHGEVRLKSFCVPPEAIADYSPLYTEDGSRSFDIVLERSIKNGFAVHLSGVNNKEDADALKGVTLFADRDQLPSLPDDEFYYTDLVGLDVYDTGGTKLGVVRVVVDHGAGDLLEVYAPTMKTPALLPFTKAAVPTVDLAAKRIIADPPEGLFE
jgi:16S rRNA processing protein RimM